MIKTTIVGLGKIGYFYDANNRNERLTHYSSVIKDKNFTIVSVVEKKKNFITHLKRSLKFQFIRILFQQ